MSSRSSDHRSPTRISLLHFLRQIQLLPIEQVGIIRRRIPTLLLNPSYSSNYDTPRQPVFLSVDDISNDLGRGLLHVCVQVASVTVPLLTWAPVQGLTHDWMLAEHEVENAGVVRVGAGS